MDSCNPVTKITGIDNIVELIWSHYEMSPRTKRILVSISGIPGSGKSTLALLLAEKLNDIFLQHSSKPIALHSEETSKEFIGTFAVDIPMDGYHLSRAELRAFPDPEIATHRRGAAFTYDSTSYCHLVQQLSKPLGDGIGIIYAPAFDHATKDPVANSIAISETTRIAILEGNYVNFDRQPWSTAAQLFDVRLMLDVDMEVARDRLIKRHVTSGICDDEKSAKSRVESTDDLNAEEILQHKVEGVLEVIL